MFEKFYIRLNAGYLTPVMIEVGHDLEYGVIHLRQKGDSMPRGYIVRKDTVAHYSCGENTITCSRDELQELLGTLLQSALKPNGVDLSMCSLLGSTETEEGTSPIIYARRQPFGYFDQIFAMSDTGFFSFDIRQDAELLEDVLEDQPADKTNPAHYQFSNGTQLIDITENLDFCSGNAIKYIARSGNKYGETRMDDLLKAQWYLNRLIEKEEGNGN